MFEDQFQWRAISDFSGQLPSHPTPPLLGFCVKKGNRVVSFANLICGLVERLADLSARHRPVPYLIVQLSFMSRA